MLFSGEHFSESGFEKNEKKKKHSFHTKHIYIDTGHRHFEVL